MSSRQNQFIYIGCPTIYQTRHFFNNSKTNEDIATRFEQEYVRCVRNEEECVCSVPAAHNLSHLLRRNHQNSCIYGNLQHLCKSIGRWGTLSWILQQDGATSHTSHASMAEIQSFFGDRVISKGLWPPRSPDLTPPDYFLWAYLKGRFYQNKPRTIDAFKANITEEIQAVTADVLARTFQNMARRVQSCLDANGGHFQHMLWCRHISYTMR